MSLEKLKQEMIHKPLSKIFWNASLILTTITIGLYHFNGMVEPKILTALNVIAVFGYIGIKIDYYSSKIYRLERDKRNLKDLCEKLTKQNSSLFEQLQQIKKSDS